METDICPIDNNIVCQGGVRCLSCEVYEQYQEEFRLLPAPFWDSIEEYWAGGLDRSTGAVVY